MHDPSYHESTKDLFVYIHWYCQVEEALRVVVFDCHPEANVFPMVPQNKSIGEMILEAPAT